MLGPIRFRNGFLVCCGAGLACLLPAAQGAGKFSWFDEMPASIEATAEDTLISIIQFESGTLGQWTSFCAGHGRGLGAHAIYGSRGSMNPGGARNGVPPRLALDNQEEITGEALLDLVPDFHLDGITARLFGGERLGSYQMPFPNADRKLLAIEYYEFAECVLTGRQPEVDGLMARKDVALLIDNRAATRDLMKAEAITIVGFAAPLRRGSRWKEMAAVLLERHPHLEEFISSASTALICVEVTEYVHVSRFQRVSTWKPTDGRKGGTR